MAADPAWVTELSKAENDALRQAGDVPGIVSKYNAPAGTPVWSDAPQGEFIDLANSASLTQPFDWLAGLTNAELDAFRNTHTIDGMVDLDESGGNGTRAALTNSTGWTAEMTTAVTARYRAPAQKLYETLGLANVGESGIKAALAEISDTPQYEFEQRKTLIRSIKSKSASGALHTTSTANLTTIDSIIGG